MVGAVMRRVAARGMVAGLTVLLAGCYGVAYPVQVVQPAPVQRFDLAADVLFDFNSASLRPDSVGALSATLASIRQAYASPRVQVQGFTDSIGTVAFNNGLSVRRAQAVQGWLVANGIPPANVTAEGFGQQSPVAPNTLPDGSDNPQGRAANRRVVLVASPS